ncbi:fatty-acid-binding protein 3, chloroplastic isoform X2 [Panicum virgatum]|uniref:fatty-acid-binding protein 3, chloroplastic isoform X2 n=1 Tax=Panicum virgatum TaxID=38727 RepID=UPI0019D5200E|nr:fatty-acid-binding protein 3, chloroplastic isoform X2 [Panicum virgatum]
MSLASVVSSARTSSPALARGTAGSCRRAARTRHLPLGGAQVPSACQLACRFTRSAARRLPVAPATGGGAVGDAFVTEGSTNVKFPRELIVPGYTGSLVILGTAPAVKSLSIILVRDVDGKTFVNALNDVIARQIKKPNAEEESSLSTFQNTFLGRNLKQGTSIYLTWLEPSRMLISISENQDPSQVDAEIKSATVNYALYDGFFGNSPVSPSLRSYTAQLLEALLRK